MMCRYDHFQRANAEMGQLVELSGGESSELETAGRGARFGSHLFTYRITNFLTKRHERRLMNANCWQRAKSWVCRDKDEMNPT